MIAITMKKSNKKILDYEKIMNRYDRKNFSMCRSEFKLLIRSESGHRDFEKAEFGYAQGLHGFTALESSDKKMQNRTFRTK